MSTVVGCDPASRPRASWVARLAYLKSQGVGDGDPRVVECRSALAYYRIQKAICGEQPVLTRAGVDRLVEELRGGGAVISVVRSRKRSAERESAVQVVKAEGRRGPVRYVSAPVDGFSQAEARERARVGYSVEYGGRSAWSLVAEVREVCAPLAAEIAAVMASEPLFLDRRDYVTPGRYALHHEVDQLAEGVRLMRDKVVALLASEVGAPREVRARLKRMAGEPGFHVTPEISVEDLRSGGWVELLVGLVEPLEADLVAALRRVKVLPGGWAGNVSIELREALGLFYSAAAVLEGRPGRIARVREAQRNHRRAVGERVERERRQERERVADGLRRMNLSK